MLAANKQLGEREKIKELLLRKNLYQQVEDYWLFLRGSNSKLELGDVIDQMASRLNTGSSIEEVVKLFTKKHKTEKNAYYDDKIDETTKKIIEDLSDKVNEELSFFKSLVTLEPMQRPVLPTCGHYHEEKEFIAVEFKCTSRCGECFPPDYFYDEDYAKACESFAKDPAYRFYTTLKKDGKLPKDLKSLSEGYEQRRLARRKPFMDEFKKIYNRYTELCRPTILPEIKPLPKEFHLKRIAVTECGHYAELDSKQCPDCKAEFVYPPVEVDVITDKVQEANKRYKDLVETMPLPKNFRQLIAENNDEYLCNNARFVQDDHRDAYIQRVINNLKIDRNNAKHLEYWNAKTHSGFFNKGGKDIFFKNVNYKLPLRIWRLMVVVDRQRNFSSIDEFWNIVHEVRADYSYNPFMMFFRDPGMNMLLSLNNQEFVKAAMRPGR